MITMKCVDRLSFMEDDEPLAKGTGRWIDCANDVQSMLLGQAPPEPDKRIRRVERFNTAPYVVLNRELRLAAQSARPGIEWTHVHTWDAISETLASVPDEPPSKDQTLEVRLYGAKVLLVGLAVPPDDSAAVPAAQAGESLATLRIVSPDPKATPRVSAKSTFNDSISLRKMHLTRLYGITEFSAFKYDGRPTKETADALLEAVLKHIQGGASVQNSEVAVDDQRVLALADGEGVEPIELARKLVDLAGLTPADSIADLGDRLQLLAGVRDTLDRFQPSVFQAPLHDVAWPLVNEEASAALSWRGRNRLLDRLRGHLRSGVHIDDLPRAVLRTQVLKERWRRLARTGVVPNAPNGLAKAIAAWGDAGLPLPASSD